MFSPAAVFLPQGCCRGRQGKDPHRRMADRVRPVQTVDIRYQTYYIVTEVPRSVNAPGPWVLAEKEGWRRARAPRPSAEPFACRKRARSSPAPLQNKSTPRWGMDLFWRRRRDSNPRDAFDAYAISSRAPSTELGDFSIFGFARRGGSVRGRLNSGNYTTTRRRMQYPSGKK